MSRLPAELDRLLHDLRGPLNAIGMHVEVLKRAIGGDVTAHDSLRTIQHELARLNDMLDATMDVVAVERRATERVNLKAVVERALLETHLKDVVLVGATWPDVHGDPSLLVHAASHLLQNAVEATVGASPSPPEVRAETRGDMAALIVRDFGVGLRSTNPKALIRLRESTKPGHRGVGLVTVERIARLHGGSVCFETPGIGAQAVLLIPQAR